jgi:hypothetical protein
MASRHNMFAEMPNKRVQVGASDSGVFLLGETSQLFNIFFLWEDSGCVNFKNIECKGLFS